MNFILSRYLFLGFILLFLVPGSLNSKPKASIKQSRFNFRLQRSLPSVSDDHFQELASDGTYRYAYTGKDSYHAERRLADGTVEGETLYVRPDGIPIKVHYFANAKNGYRPKTEVLYAERLRSQVEIVAPIPTPRAHAADIIQARPSVFLAPPTDSVVIPVAGAEPGHVSAVVEGNKISIGNGLRSGENLAISSPSVTAIIGPGGRAELSPRSHASTGSGSGISISNPSTTAIIGPGGSAVLSPTATATTEFGASPTSTIILPPRDTIPRGSIWTPVEPNPIHVPTGQRSISPSVLLVPSNPSYEYTYTYSSPDSNYPLRDSSAFVNVRVNQ